MIKILVVDDQNLVREGIKILLEQTKEIQIVGEAKNGKEALQKIGLLQPDIALLDIEMPDISGLVVAKKIRSKFPEVKTIMLSTHEDSEYMQKATSCGAKGYLLKSVSSQELEWSIRLVYQGYSAIKSELLEQQQLSQSEEIKSSKQAQVASFPQQNHSQQNHSQQNHSQQKKSESNLKIVDKEKSRTLNLVPTSRSTKNNVRPNFEKVEALFAQNHQVGSQSIAHPRRRKKTKNRLLHGVNLLRFKRTVSSFEFKLLICIILFSLGFLVFIALAS